jgi:DNA-binding IclR family transcriptional regulator
VIPEDVQRLIRDSIKSVWTLDVLLLMRRGGDKSWPLDELTRELRGNRTLVHDVLSALAKAGLVEADEAGNYRYRPADAEADALVERLEKIYVERPLALIKEIVSAPNEKIQSFADAFKLKKD